MATLYAVKSYLYLRIAMITVIAMLLVAVVVEWLNTDARCWQESISAYYYTPVQSIFVGALITIGVCMIALKGTREEEDILLNLGGMLAPVVALVPTPGPGDCRSIGEAVAAAPENIENNVIALFAAGVIALVVAVSVRTRQVTQDLRRQSGLRRLGLLSAVVIVLGSVGWFSFGRASFDGNAHYTAAIVLFVCIIAVVLLNSRRLGAELPGDHRWAARYLTIALTMIVSGVGLVVVTWVTGWSHGILITEAVLIVLFGTFWIIQTHELWDRSSSSEP